MIRNQFLRAVLVVAVCFFGFAASQAASNNRINEANARSLKIIETDTKIIKPKVCDIQNKALEILEILQAQFAADEVASFGDLICSKLDNLSGISAVSDLIPVLQAISQSDQIICSKLGLLQEEINALDLSRLPDLVATFIVGPIDITAVCDLTSVLDAISESEEVLCSKLEVIESKIDHPACAPISIFQSDLPTTINDAGFYCLAEKVLVGGSTDLITIAADDVTIDFNNNTIQMTGSDYKAINMSGMRNNIVIKNGGILQGGGDNFGINIVDATNIVIHNMFIQGGINRGYGIVLNGVVNGHISSVELDENIRGLKCTNCHNISIDNSIARRSTSVGFDLIASTSCCLRNCKAIGSGNQSGGIADIAGFRSTNGYGNIFENCIANGTQGFSSTDFDDIVAGFHLAGTEACSKIINCESANTTVDPDGKTVPYGILLENSISSSLTLTAVPPIPDGFSDTLSWSPDGKFMAALEASKALIVYEFNYSNYTLVQIAHVSLGLATNGVRWSPNGQYLAVTSQVEVGQNALLIYDFCRKTQELRLVAQSEFIGNDGALAMDWSPDNRFIGIINFQFSTLSVFKFDVIANILILVDQDVVAGAETEYADSIRWSPDGKYLVRTSSGASNPDEDLVIYSFNDQRANPLERIADGSIVYGIGGNGAIAAWSPDGKFIAIGNAEGDGELQVYAFDRETNEFNLVAVEGTATTTSLDWSSDGKYIAVGGTNLSKIQVFLFDRTPGSRPRLTLVATPMQTPVGSSFFVRWSPDGQFLAAGSFNNILIYEALSFPSKNIIKDNVVYCNSVDGSCPRGIGISGSSIANMIIGNTCYANPINPLVVNTNYAFVTNVFNQLFGSVPSSLQNISLGGCEPICMPEDTNLLVKQTKHKVCSVQSQLDIVESKVDVNTVFLLSLIDNLL